MSDIDASALSEDAIVTRKRVSRRSLLVKTGLGFVGTAAVAAMTLAGSGPAMAKNDGATDLVPADNKAGNPHDSDQRCGDYVGRKC